MANIFHRGKNNLFTYFENFLVYILNLVNKTIYIFSKRFSQQRKIKYKKLLSVSWTA